MEEDKLWLEGFHHFGQIKVCRQPRSSPRRRRRLEFASEISKWKNMSWNSTVKTSEGSIGFQSVSKDDTNQCSTSPLTETSISNTPNMDQIQAESDIFNDKRGFKLPRSRCARSIFPLHPMQDSNRKEPASAIEKESDKCNDSSSSRTNDDHNIHRRGRGKRIPKPKLHFDELTTPEKPIRKLRRIKIMRYLGLSPPAGSPFTLPRSRNTGN
ncbi:hypothetical protein ZOSMA_43G00840 [Zostera marina]|uniref:Uncharacterized protein n=1 Tax=Zostera marina TaxID=29655 RepID=A0A0K9P1N7_ZOSMR|nr:hypothetical protein ZOSMA_43G00840 [Zostera marina]